MPNCSCVKFHSGLIDFPACHRQAHTILIIDLSFSWYYDIMKLNLINSSYFTPTQTFPNKTQVSYPIQNFDSSRFWRWNVSLHTGKASSTGFHDINIVYCLHTRQDKTSGRPRSRTEVEGNLKAPFSWHFTVTCGVYRNSQQGWALN